MVIGAPNSISYPCPPVRYRSAYPSYQMDQLQPSQRGHPKRQETRISRGTAGTNPQGPSDRKLPVHAPPRLLAHRSSRPGSAAANGCRRRRTERRGHGEHRWKQPLAFAKRQSLIRERRCRACRCGARRGLQHGGVSGQDLPSHVTGRGTAPPGRKRNHLSRYAQLCPGNKRRP